jgi:hypothetical protein
MLTNTASLVVQNKYYIPSCYVFSLCSISGLKLKSIPLCELSESELSEIGFPEGQDYSYEMVQVDLSGLCGELRDLTSVLFNKRLACRDKRLQSEQIRKENEQLIEALTVFSCHQKGYVYHPSLLHVSLQIIAFGIGMAIIAACIGWPFLLSAPAFAVFLLCVLNTIPVLTLIAALACVLSKLNGICSSRKMARNFCVYREQKNMAYWELEHLSKRILGYSLGETEAQINEHSPQNFQLSDTQTQDKPPPYSEACSNSASAQCLFFSSSTEIKPECQGDVRTSNVLTGL